MIIKSSTAGSRTAVLVMNSGSMPLLCPFFSKCDGISVHNGADGSREFHPRDRPDTKSICDLVLEWKPGQVICGFIDEPEKKKLRGAGIDVRLGSCNCPIDELLASVSTLPEA